MTKATERQWAEPMVWWSFTIHRCLALEAVICKYICPCDVTGHPLSKQAVFGARL